MVTPFFLEPGFMKLRQEQIHKNMKMNFSNLLSNLE